MKNKKNIRYLVLWLADNCNLKCKYCYAQPVFTHELMSLETAEKAINLCKDKLRFYKQHPYINIETIKTTYPEDSIDNQILAILLELPSKCKEVLLLYYVEGYKCFEISKILKITESTVKKRLERGRKLLKKKLGVNECG